MLFPALSKSFPPQSFCKVQGSKLIYKRYFLHYQNFSHHSLFAKYRVLSWYINVTSCIIKIFPTTVFLQSIGFYFLTHATSSDHLNFLPNAPRSVSSRPAVIKCKQPEVLRPCMSAQNKSLIYIRAAICWSRRASARASSRTSTSILA